MPALFKFLNSGSPEQMFDSPNSQLGSEGSLFTHTKVICLVKLDVEAVKHEVNQIGNNSLGALTFKKFYQMIVTCGREFYQNLSYNADSGLFDVKNRYVVKITDDFFAKLTKTYRIDMLGGHEFLNNLQPFLMNSINAAGGGFVGAHPIDATHEDISEYKGKHGTFHEIIADGKSGIAFQTAQIQGNNRNLFHICFL